MRLRSRQLEDKLTELDLKIGKLPPGSLHVSHNGKYIRWYVAKDGGKSYIPSVNLITTYETADHPLTQLKIANIVKEYFLSE